MPSGPLSSVRQRGSSLGAGGLGSNCTFPGNISSNHNSDFFSSSSGTSSQGYGGGGGGGKKRIPPLLPGGSGGGSSTTGHTPKHPSQLGGAHRTGNNTSPGMGGGSHRASMTSNHGPLLNTSSNIHPSQPQHASSSSSSLPHLPSAASAGGGDSSGTGAGTMAGGGSGRGVFLPPPLPPPPSAASAITTAGSAAGALSTTTTTTTSFPHVARDAEDYNRILNTLGRPNYALIRDLFGKDRGVQPDTAPSIQISFELFEAVQTRLANTKQTLERTKTALHKSNQDHGEVVVQLRALREEYSALETRAQELDERQRELRMTNAKLDATIEELRTETSQLRAEMEGTQEKLLLQEDRLQESQNKVAEALVTISQRDASITALRRELSKYLRRGAGNKDGRGVGAGGGGGKGGEQRETGEEALQNIRADVENRAQEVRQKLSVAQLQELLSKVEQENRHILRQHHSYVKHVQRMIASYELEAMRLEDAAASHKCVKTPYYLTSTFYEEYLHPENFAERREEEESFRSIGFPGEGGEEEEKEEGGGENHCNNYNSVIPLRTFRGLTFEAQRGVDRMERIDIDDGCRFKVELTTCVEGHTIALDALAQLVSFLSTFERELCHERLTMRELHEEWRKAQVPFFVRKVSDGLAESVKRFSKGLVEVLTKENVWRLGEEQREKEVQAQMEEAQRRASEMGREEERGGGKVSEGVSPISSLDNSCSSYSSSEFGGSRQIYSLDKEGKEENGRKDIDSGFKRRRRRRGRGRGGEKEGGKRSSHHRRSHRHHHQKKKKRSSSGSTRMNSDNEKDLHHHSSVESSSCSTSGIREEDEEDEEGGMGRSEVVGKKGRERNEKLGGRRRTRRNLPDREGQGVGSRSSGNRSSSSRSSSSDDAAWSNWNTHRRKRGSSVGIRKVYLTKINEADSVVSAEEFIFETSSPKRRPREKERAREGTRTEPTATGVEEGGGRAHKDGEEIEEKSEALKEKERQDHREDDDEYQESGVKGVCLMTCFPSGEKNRKKKSKKKKKAQENNNNNNNNTHNTIVHKKKNINKKSKVKTTGRGGGEGRHSEKSSTGRGRGGSASGMEEQAEEEEEEEKEKQNRQVNRVHIFPERGGAIRIVVEEQRQSDRVSSSSSSSSSSTPTTKTIAGTTSLSLSPSHPRRRHRRHRVPKSERGGGGKIRSAADANQLGNVLTAPLSSVSASPSISPSIPILSPTSFSTVPPSSSSSLSSSSSSSSSSILSAGARRRGEEGRTSFIVSRSLLQVGEDGAERHTVHAGGKRGGGRRESERNQRRRKREKAEAEGESGGGGGTPSSPPVSRHHHHRRRSSSSSSSNSSSSLSDSDEDEDDFSSSAAGARVIRLRQGSSGSFRMLTHRVSRVYPPPPSSPSSSFSASRLTGSLISPGGGVVTGCPPLPFQHPQRRRSPGGGSGTMMMAGEGGSFSTSPFSSPLPTVSGGVLVECFHTTMLNSERPAEGVVEEDDPNDDEEDEETAAAEKRRNTIQSSTTTTTSSSGILVKAGARANRQGGKHRFPSPSSSSSLGAAAGHQRSSAGAGFGPHWSGWEEEEGEKDENGRSSRTVWTQSMYFSTIVALLCGGCGQAITVHIPSGGSDSTPAWRDASPASLLHTLPASSVSYSSPFSSTPGSSNEMMTMVGTATGGGGGGEEEGGEGSAGFGMTPASSASSPPLPSSSLRMRMEGVDGTTFRSPFLLTGRSASGTNDMTPSSSYGRPSSHAFPTIPPRSSVRSGGSASSASILEDGTNLQFHPHPHHHQGGGDFHPASSQDRGGEQSSPPSSLRRGSSFHGVGYRLYHSPAPPPSPPSGGIHSGLLPSPSPPIMVRMSGSESRNGSFSTLGHPPPSSRHGTDTQPGWRRSTSILPLVSSFSEGSGGGALPPSSPSSLFLQGSTLLLQPPPPSFPSSTRPPSSTSPEHDNIRQIREKFEKKLQVKEASLQTFRTGIEKLVEVVQEGLDHRFPLRKLAKRMEEIWKELFVLWEASGAAGEEEREFGSGGKGKETGEEEEWSGREGGRRTREGSSSSNSNNNNNNALMPNTSPAPSRLLTSRRGRRKSSDALRRFSFSGRPPPPFLRLPQDGADDGKDEFSRYRKNRIRRSKEEEEEAEEEEDGGGGGGNAFRSGRGARSSSFLPKSRDGPRGSREAADKQPQRGGAPPPPSSTTLSVKKKKKKEKPRMTQATVDRLYQPRRKEPGLPQPNPPHPPPLTSFYFSSSSATTSSPPYSAGGIPGVVYAPTASAAEAAFPLVPPPPHSVYKLDEWLAGSSGSTLFHGSGLMGGLGGISVGDKSLRGSGGGRGGGGGGRGGGGGGEAEMSDSRANAGSGRGTSTSRREGEYRGGAGEEFRLDARLHSSPLLSVPPPHFTNAFSSSSLSPPLPPSLFPSPPQGAGVAGVGGAGSLPFPFSSSAISFHPTSASASSLLFGTTGRFSPPGGGGGGRQSTGPSKMSFPPKVSIPTTVVVFPAQEMERGSPPTSSGAVFGGGGRSSPHSPQMLSSPLSPGLHPGRISSSFSHYHYSPSLSPSSPPLPPTSGVRAGSSLLRSSSLPAPGAAAGSSPLPSPPRSPAISPSLSSLSLSSSSLYTRLHPRQSWIAQQVLRMNPLRWFARHAGVVDQNNNPNNTSGASGVGDGPSGSRSMDGGLPLSPFSNTTTHAGGRAGTGVRPDSNFLSPFSSPVPFSQLSASSSPGGGYLSAPPPPPLPSARSAAGGAAAAAVFPKNRLGFQSLHRAVPPSSVAERQRVWASRGQQRGRGGLGWGERGRTRRRGGGGGDDENGANHNSGGGGDPLLPSFSSSSSSKDHNKPSNALAGRLSRGGGGREGEGGGRGRSGGDDANSADHGGRGNRDVSSPIAVRRRLSALLAKRSAYVPTSKPYSNVHYNTNRLLPHQR